MIRPPQPSPSFPWPLAVGVGIILLLVGLVGAWALFASVIFPTVPSTPELVTRIAEKDNMVEVYVPEGGFEMGSSDDDPGADDDEKPRHTVYLDAFWIDQTEVTNAMFAEFLNQQGNQEEGGVTWLDEENDDVLIEQVHGSFQPKRGFADHPVIQVSWYGANAYCAWAERRLPTEAEWEKAAGGTDGRKYPWGNQEPKENLANFCTENCLSHWKYLSDDYQRTSPVGNYPDGASPYGAFDMAGNVWEWVSDTYNSDYYAFSPRKNPLGPSTKEIKVHRGGAWYVPAPYIDVHLRSKGNAFNHYDSVGFRCARSL